MVRMLAEEQLNDKLPYLNDITVAGYTQEERDYNGVAFLKFVSKRNLTSN